MMTEESSGSAERVGRPRPARGRRGRLSVAVAVAGAALSASVMVACAPAGEDAVPAATTAAAAPITQAPRDSDARPIPDSEALTTPTPIEYPERGRATWRIAGGRSKVAGRAGTLLRYRVAVERGITGITAGDFATAVDATLGDRKGWTAGGPWRLQRVGPGREHDFTVYLATPATRGVMCQAPESRYVSCRVGDSVVINVARWVDGIPDYGAGLDVYRQYLVNHEVGHRLGNRHVKCPRKGGPAPVMQQQTLGLHGCTPNSWPFVKGRRHTGPAGEYADPIPNSSDGR